MAEQRAARWILGAGALLGTLALVLTGCSGSAAQGAAMNSAAAPTRPAGAGSASGSTSGSGSVSPSGQPSGGSSGPTADLQTTTGGEVVTRSIPGGSSGFAARPAEIYLPPAALASPRADLPVLELLHGTPGGPSDWVNPSKGDLVATARAFAATHHGRAPVIVMPDINGSGQGDTECIRTSGGADVETYLASVVPSWISAHLPVTGEHRDWAVAGLSEGGTCAAMLALRHPAVFSTFGDFSGLAHLTVGEHNNPPLTTKELFGGSTSAYDDHDPLYLLAHGGRRSAMAAWLQCGNRDTQVVTDQNTVVAAARSAGLTVQAVVMSGGHHWNVWANALARMLPWWWQRMSS